MVRRILLATDGSRLSKRAVQTAVRLAAALRARLVALYVIPEGVPTLFGGEKLCASPALGREYRALIRKASRDVLGAAVKAADEAEVSCTPVSRLARHPWQAILGTARARGCDLIVMASHARTGLPALALGSETAKVLTHSRIPVLVVR
jgi:nucleotide-binding universal stress UspA family protein